MPVVVTCKACEKVFPSTLEVGSLGTWQSLTVEESQEVCRTCGAVNTYEKKDYHFEA